MRICFRPAECRLVTPLPKMPFPGMENAQRKRADIRGWEGAQTSHVDQRADDSRRHFTNRYLPDRGTVSPLARKAASRHPCFLGR